MHRFTSLFHRSSSSQRWTPLLRTAVLTGVLASSLSACVPLVVGGVAGSLLLATDRRTSGAQIDDESIELRGRSRISEALQNRGHVSVTSYNRIVLLTGQVQAQADRELVETAIKTVPNVRHIANEITVGPIIQQPGNDALTSARVKTVLVGSKNVKSNAVKVVTENGVVYLMGIVTQKESEHAAAAASGVSGVVKVVKVFEIVDGSTSLPPATTIPAGVVSLPADATSP